MGGIVVLIGVKYPIAVGSFWCIRGTHAAFKPPIMPETAEVKRGNDLDE